MGVTVGERRAAEAEPEVVVREPASLARLMLELDDQWPILKFLGFGFYYAWIWLCYNSTVLIGGEGATDAVFTMYLASTTALAVTLVVAALCPRLSRGVVESRLAVAGFSLVAAVATVVAGCSSSGGSSPLFLAASALTGIGTAWVALRLGTLYSTAPARRVTLYTAASFVTACLLYFLAVGLPHQLGLPFMALLPVFAALVTMTAPDDSVLQKERPARAKALPPGFFLRLVLAIGVFSLVVGVTRGFATLTQSVGTLDEEGAVIVFGTACVAGVLYVLVSLVGNEVDVSRLYYPVTILVVLGISVVPLIGSGVFEGRFIGIAYACFIMMIWCLLAHVAHLSGLSAVRVFGLGRGASALGTTAGWLLGSQLIGQQAQNPLFIWSVSIVMVVALLIVSMLVFNDRIIGMVLRTSVAEDPEGGEGAAVETGSASCLGEAVSAEKAEATADDSGLDSERRTGAFTKRCLAVSSTYGLSQRERDVLFLLAKGRTIGYIADELGVSFNTAKSHIRHVYVKTGVHTRQELLNLIEDIGV